MYSHIYELVREGKIVFSSEENRNELANESLAFGEADDEFEPTDTDDTTTDNMEDIEPDDDAGDTPVEPEEPVEEVETVSKIQSLDIVNAAMNKFDQYMVDTNIDWNFFIRNGKVTQCENFAYVDDLYNLLNNTLDSKKLQWIEIFNNLFEKMTDISYCKNLALYGREKYGKPFLAEGMALLLYELAVDWAVLLARYFKEMPQLESTEDSFFKKFPNLQLYTYIAKLLTDSEEFGKLVTNDKARELLTDETKYKLTGDQAKKKPNLYRAKGESLSYYASLVRYNYADIMVGAIDKLGTVAFLTSKVKTDLYSRLNIIRDLIQTVSNKNVNNNAKINTPTASLDSVLNAIEAKATEILKDRSEARILLEANEKNFPMVI